MTKKAAKHESVTDRRYEALVKVFEGVPEGDMTVIEPLIREAVYLERQMTDLRKMPFIVSHPANPALQKSTPAAKQYKETSQSYMNAVRILLGVLRKADTAAETELLKKLEEFAI